jgi:hypothetical protein
MDGKILKKTISKEAGTGRSWKIKPEMRREVCGGRFGLRVQTGIGGKTHAR